MSAAVQDRLANYVPVSERLEQFYSDYPTGRILTTIVEHDAEKGFILIRAEVYRQQEDAVPAATGHAFENRSEGYVNKTSYIENCETSATGRALALLGYEIKRGIASREEMEKVERMTEGKPDLKVVPTQEADDHVACPKCGSTKLWDNRETKKGKQPDYKCRDKECGGAIWLDSQPKSNRKTFIQSISDALKLLNELNDSIVWTKATANQYVMENFDGLAGVDALDDTQLTGLLKLLDARVTTLKAPKGKGGDPKSDAIKRIRTEFEPEHVDAWLKAVHKGKALEDLSLDALIDGFDSIVPF